MRSLAQVFFSITWPAMICIAAMGCGGAGHSASKGNDESPAVVGALKPDEGNNKLDEKGGFRQFILGSSLAQLQRNPNFKAQYEKLDHQGNAWLFGVNDFDHELGVLMIKDIELTFEEDLLSLVDVNLQPPSTASPIDLHETILAVLRDAYGEPSSKGPYGSLTWVGRKVQLELSPSGSELEFTSTAVDSLIQRRKIARGIEQAHEKKPNL